MNESVTPNTPSMSRDVEVLAALIAKRLEGGWDSADARDAGNYLAPTVARLIAAARAEAWDEGHRSGWSDRVQSPVKDGWVHPVVTPNPHHAAATDDTPGGDK